MEIGYDIVLAITYYTEYRVSNVFYIFTYHVQPVHRLFSNFPQTYQDRWSTHNQINLLLRNAY